MGRGAENCSIFQKSAGWKREHKEGREQHDFRQGELAFGAASHFGQRRTLRE